MAKEKQTPKKSKKSPMDIAISISVDPRLKDAIEEVAKREDRSVSYIVRKAVEQYLASQAAA